MSDTQAGLPRRHLLLGAAAMATLPALGRGLATDAHAAAPPLGPSSTTFHRFRLGDFEVTNILDAGAVIDGPWPIVGEDQPPEAMQQLMQENLLPANRFRPGFTPSVVNTGSQLILFDTGNGADGFVPRPDGGWLAAQLAPAGFSPEQIDVVVLTHCHPDHIGGVLEGGRPLFPNARYVVGETEYDFWARAERLASDPASNEHRSAQLFRTSLVPLADRTSFVKDGGDVAPGIRAIAAHGHTPGHLAFHLESQGQRLLLWGDCAHHEVASLAKPDWHAFFDMDKAAGAATRRRIYDMAASERLAVVGYHTSFPSLGYVERRESGFRWIPATYQFDL